MPRGQTTLSSFVNSRKIPEVREAFRFLKPVVLLYGPTGCGKQHTASQVANEMSPTLRLVDLTDTLLSDLSRLVFFSSETVASIDGRQLRVSDVHAISDFVLRRPLRLVIFADQDTELVHQLSSQICTCVKFRPVTDLNIAKYLRTKLPQISDQHIQTLVLEINGDLRSAANLVSLLANCNRKRKLTTDEEPASGGSEISFFHALGRTLHRKPETFHVPSLLESPNVVGNFMFINFVHENAVDFLKDTAGLKFFWNYLAISDRLDDFNSDHTRLALVLHAWQVTADHQAPGGFRELRKPRKLEIRKISDHIVRYTRTDDHCMSRSERADRLFFSDTLLALTQGTFFARLPNFVLTSIHSAANWRPELPVAIRPRVEYTQHLGLEDEIEEVNF